MNEIPAQIGVFLLVDRPVHPDKIPGPGRGEHVLQNGLVAPVHILLGGLGHIDVAKAAGASRRAEQGVHDKGVQPMVIPPPLPVLMSVFRGKQHRVPYEFAVVQHLFSLLRLFVVPVDDGSFVRGVHPVLGLGLLARVRLSGQLPLQLGVGFQQPVIVLHPQIKQIPGLLQVRNAAFPVQVQHIHPAQGNVSQAALLFRVPEDPVNAGTAFELVIHHPVIDLLKVLLLQNHRQDAAQGLGQGLIVFLPGQHIGPGKIVHGLGVFVGNGVEEPAGSRFHLFLCASAHTFPVPHPVPLFILNDPPLQVGLALAVPVQGLPGFPQFLRADHILLFHVESPFPA